MDFKFCKIQKQGFVFQEFTAKIDKLEDLKTNAKGENYLRILLSQGKSKITALSYKDTYTNLKNILKVGQKVTFLSKTFKSKLIDKDFKHLSSSTCKFDLIFANCNIKIQGKMNRTMAVANGNGTVQPVSSTSRNGNLSTNGTPFNDSGIIKANLKRAGKGPFELMTGSVKFYNGGIYRYWGCSKCTFSIPRSRKNGKFYCEGRCSKIGKRGPGRSAGVETERKLCMIAQNVCLKDEVGNTMQNLIIFDGECQKLLRKSSSEFLSDEGAIDSWNGLKSLSFYMKVQRTKRKSSGKFPATVFLKDIRVNQWGGGATSSKCASVSNDALDLKIPEFDGEKKQKKKEGSPDFPNFEIKLQKSSNADIEVPTERYQLNSKPPGLVLLVLNHFFPDSDDPERKGARKDANTLQKGFEEVKFELFQNKIHFNISTKKEFETLREAFKTELIERDIDSSIVIVSSHGFNYEVTLSGATGYLNVVEDILLPFSEDNFKEFQGKPKIFFPLTCQHFGSHVVPRAQVETCLSFLGNRLFNMLVCFPSFAGFASRRYHSGGTLFVQHFVKNLMNLAEKRDLRTILDITEVNVADQIIKHNLQITPPCVTSSVFRKLYYFLPQKNENVEIEPMQMDEDEN